MKAKTLIRIFALLLFLAAIIAGLAWGGIIDDCVEDGSCIIATTLIDICPSSHYYKDGLCILKKGHCPHCGVKAIEDSHGLQVIKGSDVLWTIRRCPAGHLFWEKD